MSINDLDDHRNPGPDRRGEPERNGRAQPDLDSDLIESDRLDNKPDFYRNHESDSESHRESARESASESDSESNSESDDDLDDDLEALIRGTSDPGRPARSSRPAHDMEPYRPGPLRVVLRVVAILVVVAIFTVVLAGTAHRVASDQEPVYAARVEIAYELDADRAAGFLREDRRLSTQVVMISGPNVLAPVAREFDMTWEELAEAVTAEVLQDSEVIQIEARSDERGMARRVLNAIVAEYLAQTEDDEISERRAVLEADLIDAQFRFEAAKAELAAAPPERVGAPSIEVRRLLAEHSALVARIVGLEAELTELDLEALEGSPAEVITAAYVLDEPVEPQVVRSAAVGGALGLMIGLLWAILVTRLVRLRRS